MFFFKKIIFMGNLLDHDSGETGNVGKENGGMTRSKLSRQLGIELETHYSGHLQPSGMRPNHSAIGSTFWQAGDKTETVFLQSSFKG